MSPIRLSALESDQTYSPECHILFLPANVAEHTDGVPTWQLCNAGVKLWLGSGDNYLDTPKSCLSMPSVPS